jgi:hypothetical protein
MKQDSVLPSALGAEAVALGTKSGWLVAFVSFDCARRRAQVRGWQGLALLICSEYLF